MSHDDQKAPRDAWPHLHLWQIQPLRDLLVLAAVVGIVYLGYVLSIVTVPILLALALAYLFEPLVRRMTDGGRIGRARVAASILLLSGMLVLVPLAIGMTYSVMQGVRYVQGVIRSIDVVSQSVRAPEREDLRLQVQIRSNAWLMIRDYIVEERAKAAVAEDARKRAATIESESPKPSDALAQAMALESVEEPSDLFRLLEFTREFLQQHSTELGRNLLQAGGGAVGAVFSLVSSGVKFVTIIALTAFFFFFFSTGYGQVLAFWESLLPEHKKGSVLDLVSKMDAVISGFIRGRLIICATMIGVYTVGYVLIGAPAAWIAGLVVGALTLVPYAAGVAAPVIMLLMWLEPGEGWQASWWWIIGSPLAVLGVSQVLDDYVLTPRIQGKATNMDTPTILFASIAGGSLAGFYGLLLAIPIAACIKILLKEVFWPRVRDWATGKADDVLPISKD
ncbi:MAG: AI-2E family transporter [Phycisphaerales bacterium]|jgi:predicted PurR-regulated permease PerM